MRLDSALFAYLHHLAAFVVVAMLTVEHALFASVLSLETARKLRRIDLYYGIAAGVLVIVGLLRVFYFEKGAQYYFANTWFLVKLGLFLMVGLVSIYPTIVFQSWAKGLRAGIAPQMSPVQVRRVKLALRLEMAAILVILLAAALMARGFGSR